VSDSEVVVDPYRACTQSCTHDLAKGVLTESELCKVDGPFELVPVIQPVYREMMALMRRRT
jgi:hypothetical protein